MSVPRWWFEQNDPEVAGPVPSPTYKAMLSGLRTIMAMGGPAANIAKNVLDGEWDG